MLTSEAWPVIDAVSTPANLERLWRFFDKAPPLNPLMASFVSRTIIWSLQKRTEVVRYFK